MDKRRINKKIRIKHGESYWTRKRGRTMLNDRIIMVWRVEKEEENEKEEKVGRQAVVQADDRHNDRGQRNR